MKDKIYYSIISNTALYDEIEQKQINDALVWVKRGTTIFLIQTPDVQAIYKSII